MSKLPRIFKKYRGLEAEVYRKACRKYGVAPEIDLSRFDLDAHKKPTQAQNGSRPQSGPKPGSGGSWPFLEDYEGNSSCSSDEAIVQQSRPPGWWQQPKPVWSPWSHQYVTPGSWVPPTGSPGAWVPPTEAPKPPPEAEKLDPDLKERSSELLIKRDYQGQKMRVKRAELYREDIRDLVQLTVRKMDNYLVVSTLQLGFCMTLYVEGRPKPDIGLPLWLIHLFAICNAGAFLYYILSIWLAMHASVAAHAFGVRLLTQVVRLPIPDDATLDKSRFKALQYEGNKVKEMFRVPVLQQQIQRFTQAMDKTDEEDSVSAEVASHLELHDVGNVGGGERCSIPGIVLRGDIHYLRLGSGKVGSILVTEDSGHRWNLTSSSTSHRDRETRLAVGICGGGS
eukprot:g27541.t2